MGLRIPSGREQTSWLFTSMVKNWTREDWEQIQLAAGGDLNLEPPNCKSSALTTQLPPAAM